MGIHVFLEQGIVRKIKKSLFAGAWTGCKFLENLVCNGMIFSYGLAIAIKFRITPIDTY